MPVGDIGRQIAARGDTATILRGVVVVDPATGGWAVNSGGALLHPKWTDAATPTVGDRVRIAEFAGERIVIGRIVEPAPPDASASRQQPPAPLAPPAPPRTGTSTYPAIDSGYWSTVDGWAGAATYGSRLMQGTSEGTNTGAWFYGVAPAELAGRTIVAARVRIMRSDQWGAATAQPAHLRAHSSAYRPASNVALGATAGDVTLPRGGDGWFPVAVAAAQAVVAGGGLGIAGAPHLVLEGVRERSDSGLLQIDWAR